MPALLTLPGSLADGVAVPEYGVRIPRGCSRDDLFRLIPHGAFRRKDHWPTLRFALLGATKVFGFNVCGCGGGLRMIQFDGRSLHRRMFRRIGHQLIAALGPPNTIDCSTSKQQTWRFDDIVIEQVAFDRGKGRVPNSAMRQHLIHVLHLR